MTWKSKLSQRLSLTLYYTAVTFFSHLMMFILMTYNVGIICVVLLGNAVGFYFFSLKEKKPQIAQILNK
jgi:hypothetical protein